MRDWTNYRLQHLDCGRGFKPKGKYFVTHGTSDNYENYCRHLFDSCDPVKTQVQDILRREQAVRPRWKRREGQPKNAAVTLLSFSGESWEASCLFSVCALSVI